MDNLKNNHTLHGALVGLGTFYLMNKNGSDKALRYALVFGLGSALYMNQYGHTKDGFTELQNMFSGSSQGTHSDVFQPHTKKGDIYGRISDLVNRGL